MKDRGITPRESIGLANITAALHRPPGFLHVFVTLQRGNGWEGWRLRLLELYPGTKEEKRHRDAWVQLQSADDELHITVTDITKESQ